MHPCHVLALFAALTVACQSREPVAAPEIVEDAVQQEEIVRIARDFPTWGALDTALRVAPTDCRMPRIVSHGSLTISLAEGGPHGMKLYRLYARDPAAYRGVESGARQDGQVIVKEAFRAEPFKMPGPGRTLQETVSTPTGVFRAGAPAGLFVMRRGAGVGERAWTYATVAPSGEITALGRIDSCIRCHREAPYDGLFGLERGAFAPDRPARDGADPEPLAR